MSLELQHLPPGVVAYLDALGRPGGQAKSLHGDFLTHLEMVGEWIENLSGDTMDDPEVDQFANISALLESLRVTAEEVSWGEQLPLLVRDLYPMFAMMDRINKRREIAHHSTQAAVNDALLCGVAFLKKRAEWPALENRLDKLDAYLQGMELTLLGLKSRLQPEVVASLQSGIEAMRDGMDGLDPDRSEAENQKGLATLKEGSEILQLLIDWKVQDDEKFRREHQRFFLPGAGPAVESFLEALDGTSREQWGPALQALGQDTLPRLRSDWLALRRRLFVNPDEREAMWDEIEAALVGLEECLEELGDPGRSEDEALLGFEEAAEQLQGVILEGQRWPPEQLEKPHPATQIGERHQTIKSGVCIGGNAPEIGDALIHERRRNGSHQLWVGKAAQGRYLGRGEPGPVVGNIQTSIGRQAVE